jgi:hypothetical protein
LNLRYSEKSLAGFSMVIWQFTISELPNGHEIVKDKISLTEINYMPLSLSQSELWYRLSYHVHWEYNLLLKALED